MDGLQHRDTLHDLLGETNFVLQTQAQIAKDFAKFNLYLPDDAEMRSYSLEELLDVVGKLMAEIMQHGERRLLQLLYTIDIPEKDFLSLIGTNDFLNKLSEKVILREAFKVYLRTKY